MRELAVGQAPDTRKPLVDRVVDPVVRAFQLPAALAARADPGEEDVVARRPVAVFLKRLQFHAFDDRFDCTRAELIKLGKRADPAISDDGAALRHGATQFKVNFDQLRKVIDESDWAKKNILIAVAGGAGDGTSGVRQAADATVRQEIEKFAQHYLLQQCGAAGVLDRPAGRDD